MLDKEGFDLWAEEYDRTVRMSDEKDTYPFAGYNRILQTIFREVMRKPQSNVLEIGIGTGNLASRLYENGHHIDGIDFSETMITLAQEKMPNAHLMKWDIREGIPNELRDKKYDAIISTYTLHHLTDEEKISFILSVFPLLKDDGKVYIGDISFHTRAALEKCRQEHIAQWDDDEYYFVYDELTRKLENHCTCHYEQMSHCGGLFILSR